MAGRSAYRRPYGKIEEVSGALHYLLNVRMVLFIRIIQRILVLTGPSGSAKTATLQVLAKEFEAEVVEWHASSDEFSMNGDYGVSRIFLTHLL
jgi:replication-associated recombination protein RarA